MGAEFSRRHQQQGGSLCSDYSSDGLKRYYRLNGRDATLGAERGWLRVEAPSKVGRHAQHAKGLSGYFGFAFSCGGTGGGQVADSWGALLLLPLPALADSTRKMSGSVEEEEVSSTEDWLEDWFFSLSTSWSLACARK